MNKSDIIKLIRILSANYRNWPEEGKEEDTVTLWEMMLRDITVEVAKGAIQVHMSRSAFPPTISDIKSAAERITNPPTMDAIEAWDLIGTAIRRFGFYRQEEAMKFLPEDVGAMVRRFTWRELCLCDNIDTLRAQFRMAWETMAKRQKEERLIPAEVMAMLETPNLIKRLQ